MLHSDSPEAEEEKVAGICGKLNAQNRTEVIKSMYIGGADCKLLAVFPFSFLRICCRRFYLSMFKI